MWCFIGHVSCSGAVNLYWWGWRFSAYCVQIKKKSSRKSVFNVKNIYLCRFRRRGMRGCWRPHFPFIACSLQPGAAVCFTPGCHSFESPAMSAEVETSAPATVDPSSQTADSTPGTPPTSPSTATSRVPFKREKKKSELWIWIVFLFYCFVSLVCSDWTPSPPLESSTHFLN